MSNEPDRHAVFCELVSDVARSAGEVRLRVTGASMLPAVWPGDVLTVSRCGISELCLGHIALYRRDGRLTAHRVESIAGNSIITKGDSLLAADPPVVESEIIGHVVGISRGARSLQPGQTLLQRVASSILSRSDLLMRVALGLQRRLRASENLSTPDASSPQAGK